MPEIKRIVKPVEINYVCDKCSHGMMQKTADMDKQTGEVEHKCMICGHVQVFKWLSYPRITYIGEDEVL